MQQKKAEWAWQWKHVQSHERWLFAAKLPIIHALPRPVVYWLARALTLLLSVPMYTVYLLPLRFLPYYDYFINWRKMSFARNFLRSRGRSGRSPVLWPGRIFGVDQTGIEPLRRAAGDAELPEPGRDHHRPNDCERGAQPAGSSR